MKAKKLLALCLTASTLALTACNDDTIYPGLNHDEISFAEGTSDYFTQEDLDYIYEKLHDGTSTGETVRDYIINEYAKSYIGDYRIKDGKIILIGYDESKDGTPLSDQDKQTFIENHTIYHNRDFSSNETTYEDFDSSLMSDYDTRVNLFKDLIYKNVVTTLFTEANSDTYKVDNKFQEVLYARSKFPTYKVGDFDETFTDNNIYDKSWEVEIVYNSETQAYEYPTGMDKFTNGILIDSTISSENLDSIVGTDNSTGLPMLHLDLYEDYINRELMPDIINNLLVSQYIYDNLYTTLSRTQARKINYVAITYTQDNVSSALRLLYTYVNNVIANGLNPHETVADGEVIRNDNEYYPLNFDVISDAWKGIADDDPTYVGNMMTESVSFRKGESLTTWTGLELLENTPNGFNKVSTHDEAINYTPSTVLPEDQTSETSYIDGKEHTYYENTQYGELMQNFALINEDRNDATSVEQWNSFTNTNEYSYQHGLELQTNNIRIEDYTGYISGTASDGFSDLPSTITDNLFEYSVSLDTPVSGEANLDDNSYVVEQNGRYFLKRDISQSQSLQDSIILNDSNSSTFYIVEIEYALNQSKMTPTSEGDTNASGYTNEQIEALAREIGYALGSGDTYTNTAYQHYLEESGIEYNDQSIYDYMLSTYPDLFEEE